MLYLETHQDCYGLSVRLPYIIITCTRIDSIKRVSSELPCCPGVFSELSSVHDNFGDKDGILRDILQQVKKVKTFLNKIHKTFQDAKQV